MNFSIKHPENLGGMNERIRRLRQENIDTPVTLSIERALIETEFYKQNYGTMSTPVLRARNFYEICKKKTIYIGPDELIVGERGPRPKAVPTFPELTCHSVEDLQTLDTRELQSYHIKQEDIDTYEREVIPYWKGKTQRERIFNHVSREWEEAYHAGVFTEFMEQRAAGHTAMDGKMYHTGLLDVKARIEKKIASLDFINDPEATDRQQELEAMAISCDAAILFAERHAELAEEMADKEQNPQRKKELEKIASVCRWVPAHAPRDLWEAVQMYWFVHLGTVTELNGWDSMNPGHIDQHLWPFYEQGLRDGTLTRDEAKELLSCLWIKFNNQPAPPKVGVTALESGTYNDFTNINIGGVDRNGNSAANELSTIILEIQEELHQLQPGLSIHIAKNTPDEFLLDGMRVIRQGHGYPSIFNPDTYVSEMVRAGKTVEDAREGGCSGCIEVGAFGKEAYLLTGYLNTPKILEITLNNGLDPETGKQLGLETGDPREFKTFDQLYDAWHLQIVHFVDMKLAVNNYIERMFALYAPATFLSLFIDDCIEKGKDYYSGGARYNTTYIQCTGLGTITDSLCALKKHVFEDKRYTMDEVLEACRNNWEGGEVMRQYIRNHTPFFGNDDTYADEIAVRVYDDLVDAIEGRPNTRGGQTHLNMLSTTCHNYFGSVCGATPDGRFAHFAISDGTSPAHGSDSHGPTAVIKSLSKLDQTKSGGTLLNVRFTPTLLRREQDMAKVASLVRTYFKRGGHHIQFNIVDTQTLLDAQRHPDEYRDLLVRVAGYSDYFNDMTAQLQNEIIARTENSEI
jgi:formate C-acetyltransferase